MYVRMQCPLDTEQRGYPKVRRWCGEDQGKVRGRGTVREIPHDVHHERRVCTATLAAEFPCTPIQDHEEGRRQQDRRGRQVSHALETRTDIILVLVLDGGTRMSNDRIPGCPQPFIDSTVSLLENPCLWSGRQCKVEWRPMLMPSIWD